MDKKTEDTYKEEEYTREMRPYMAYFQAIEEVFDLSLIDSFADMGCNNGRLMEAWHDKYPATDLFGIDYFDWSKQYAAASIKEKVIIGDLSKPYSFGKKYDIVNCSEVGEHIARAAEDPFIDNLAEATGDILLLTWSNQDKDHDGQHLNPRPQSYVIKKLAERGLEYWQPASKKLSAALGIKLEGIGYQWWSKNIMVFKRKRFASVHGQYMIQNISTDNGSHKEHFQKNNLIPVSFQESFMNLTGEIFKRVDQNKGMSIVRASDGDYFFLRKIAVGSAKPGKRALVKGYEHLNMNLFRSMLWQHDIITLNSERRERRSWMKFIVVEYVEKVISKIMRRPVPAMQNGKLAYAIDRALFPITLLGIIPYISAWLFSLRRGKDYFRKAKDIIFNNSIPSEAVYALVATKWVFKHFKNEIGIIASLEKTDIIKELMKHEEYRRYVGVDQFTDYISVPAKGAADDVLVLSEKLGEQIKNSKAKLFLVGAGSSKLALMPLLRHYTNAVFIDVGAGIDALAGIVSQDRPYFAEWTNFKLKDYDYSKVDFMDQGNPARNDPKYKTVIL